jgi:hypothetical protein
LAFGFLVSFVLTQALQPFFSTFFCFAFSLASFQRLMQNSLLTYLSELALAQATQLLKHLYFDISPRYLINAGFPSQATVLDYARAAMANGPS